MRVKRENKFVKQREVIKNFETKYAINNNMQNKERVCCE